jgi:uroporphyrinogen decarboxylase
LSLENAEAVLQHLGADIRRFFAEVHKEQPVPPQVMERYSGQGQLLTSCYGVVLLTNPNFPQDHRVYGPLYETTDLDRLNWPQASDVVLESEVAAEIKRCNDEGLCSVIACDNPFKIAYFMRPFDAFMMDCVLEPELVLDLMRRILSVELARIKAGVRAGARAAIISGDFADQRNLMISPPTFRRVLKPILAEYVQELKAVDPDLILFLHSDGNLIEILPDLIECGFQAVHPIQPESMDMSAVKQQFGDRLTLFGGISVQTELTYLSTAEIRDLVRRRVDTLGLNGGFIFAPSNTVLPDVPAENSLAAFEEAARIV